MEIFNVRIYGTDADWFVSQCKKDQKKWILGNTNQEHEELIDAFLENLNRGKDECDDCKKAKHHDSKPVSAKTTAASKHIDAATDGGNGDSKGRG